MSEAADALRTVAPALAFLLVGVPLAALLDELGFFDAAAVLVQRRWPDVPVLALWALAAATTIVLNLDTTVVLLTPLYVRLARRAGADPLPLALVPLLLAAFASSVLPISNLTTLIATEQLDLSVGDVVRHLALPSAAAVVVGWACYRRRHPTHLRGSGPVAAVDLRPVAIGAPIVVAVLVGVTLGPSFGVPPWVVVLVVDAVLVGITRLLPWRTVPVGTAAAVGAVAALVGWAVSPSLMDPIRRLTGPLAVAGVALLGTATANVVNNIPATLLMVEGSSHASPATWGWLLGVNVGAAIVPIGALANLLWLRILRAEGIDLDLRGYLRLVVGIAVPALVAAIAVQALQSVVIGHG
ncbi:SLC13 family permease [Aquihabitans sp. McL0605]|uniref:SLC13 family permease n=1 Tax=Aquihabitans sp. McL0605 TaxID=3415671 RepID=UPI003CF4B2D0